MSKTYTLQATLNTGRLIGSDTMEPSWSNFLTWNDAPSNVGRAGYDNPYWRYATNMMFDQTTLSSLRNKVSNGITITGLTLTVNCEKEMTGETLVGYKYNSTASGYGSSGAWTRCHNDGTSGSDIDSVAYLIPAQSLSTGLQTFDLYRANPNTGVPRPYSGIPQYGLVAGPQTNVNGTWRFTSATLNVTTNEITVSYNKGANGSGTNVTDTITSGATLRGATFTRTGYTQTGWATSDGGAKVYNLSATYSGTSDLTLYPYWTIISYTVSYNVNGGSGTFQSQTKNYGSSITLHSGKPTPPTATSAGSYTVTYNGNGGSPGEASKSAARTTNYTFSTWNTAQNGSGTSYAAGATYSANASATLYAQYTSSTTTASITLTTATRTGYNFNGWYTQASGGTRVGGAGSSYTPTGNVTLYAQWTASSATLSSVSPTTIDCGGTLTGNWTSTGPYYYWLRVTCGNGVGRWSSSSASGTGSLSLTVQIPTEWYTMTDGPMRDSDRATATCTLYTYSDSAGTVLVGTPSSLTFTVTVPSNVAPTLGALTYTSSSDNAVVSGWGNTTFVQGYSKVTLTQSVSSYNGSRFSSVRYSGLGLDSTKTGSLASSDPSSVINSAGTLTYTATVTDTRGRSSSKTVTVTFQPYAQPSIAGIAVQRCDSDGTVNNSAGAYFKATPVYSFSPVTVSGTAKNALVTQNIKYRVHPNGAWSTATTCASGSTYGPWSALLTNSYDVMVTLADRIQNGSSQTTTFTTTLPTVQGIWFGKGNDRIGLGGVPEGAGLWCDWDATFKGVLDVVPRRCYATLSSAGWYRAFSFDYSSGAAVDIVIGVGTATTHKVSLMFPSVAYAKFVDETSDGPTTVFDKIRFIANSSLNKCYVDIHFNEGGTRTVYVNAIPYGTFYYTINSSNLTAVADSPSGETVVMEYTFAANTNVELPVTYVSNNYVDSAAVGRLHFWIRGDVIVCLFNLGSVSSMATGTDFVKIGSVALPRSLPADYYATIPAQNGSGTLLVQIKANGDISIANASGTTASGFYRSTFSFVMV